MANSSFFKAVCLGIGKTIAESFNSLVEKAKYFFCCCCGKYDAIPSDEKSGGDKKVELKQAEDFNGGSKNQSTWFPAGKNNATIATNVPVVAPAPIPTGATQVDRGRPVDSSTLYKSTPQKAASEKLQQSRFHARYGY
jgi:hypothetical protein